MAQPPAFFSLFGSLYRCQYCHPQGQASFQRGSSYHFRGIGRWKLGGAKRRQSPRRGAACRKEELEALEERGSVAQIDLVVSDALQGTGNAVCAAFPRSPISCLKRQILNCVSNKDEPQLDEPIPQGFICYLSFTGQ